MSVYLSISSNPLEPLTNQFLFMPVLRPREGKTCSTEAPFSCKSSVFHGLFNDHSTKEGTDGCEFLYSGGVL